MKKVSAVVVPVLVLAALSGCGSKKDKAGQPSAPQKAGQPASQQGSVVVASPQDEADVVAAKARVLAHIKAGDFAAVYREASAGFREVGPEQQFVALWKQQLMQTGEYRELKEVSHTVRPEDRFLLFFYHVQYENAKKVLRLTFGRSKAGKMELTGINQQDLVSGK